jgi:glycosyltransferase involved in cell wall biosynthesis
VSNRSLTIVLPVYNAESRLTNSVHQILEMASALTPHFSILIVDDGSTDDTSTVAQELSMRYPQIAVRRHRQRHGLGPIIDMVRRRVTSDVVIVHDGVSPIQTTQLRRLWQQSVRDSRGSDVEPACDVSELTLVRATHEAMAKAHDRVLGFHLLESARPSDVRPNTIEPHAPHTPTNSRPTDRAGVGQIPPLPRPNFLSAVTEFALGE